MSADRPNGVRHPSEERAIVVALGLMCTGIYALPVTVWIKGYFVIGLFFTVGSAFTLAKTMRDSHEHRKLVNRLKEAKTERLLTEYEARV